MVVRLAAVAATIAILVGCQEYRVRNEGQPVAEPPGEDLDLTGNPPDDWQDCPRGLQGYYYNLQETHPYVTSGRVGAAMDTLFNEDDLSFDRYDPSLEFGEAWYPVDDGLAADPDGFSVRWVGWIRGWSDSTLSMVLGASDDAQVLIDGEVVAEVVDSPELLLGVHSHYLDGGVYPFEVRYAQRGDASAMRFRITEGDASLCIPSYSEE
ncbi:MAG: hypothetical protein EP330_17680 [Deltaproteobacteria bacterium]|nr:MAG: hypothetical protein EP330_17680 [Deltaproteobacteria bacterium]